MTFVIKICLFILDRLHKMLIASVDKVKNQLILHHPIVCHPLP
jgi:hypothetical protein